jgi:hypothetical protein
MQNGERPLGLAVLSLYDMVRTAGPALFVIVIVQTVFASPRFLVDLESYESSQAAEYAKHHNTEHTPERLSASPPYEVVLTSA